MNGKKMLQKGWYLKPGAAFSFAPKSKTTPYLESSLLFSFGELKWNFEVEDPIYGNSPYSLSQSYFGGGAAAAFGFYPLRLGAYRFRLSGEVFIGGFDEIQGGGYMPGAGRLVDGVVINMNSSLRLHLLREW